MDGQPDDKAGSWRPRRAADACRAVALLLLVAGAIVGIIVGSGDNGAVLGGLAVAAADVVALAVWIASVFLAWAAALYEELRRE